jgi:predicted transcriptional regulator
MDINKEQQATIKEFRERGKTYQEIADIFGISRQRVHQIIHGTDIEKQQLRQQKKLAQELFLQDKVNEILEKIMVGKRSKNITTLTGIKHGARERYNELVRIRDGHRCQICGKKWKKGTRRFDVHHLDENIEKIKVKDRNTSMYRDFQRMITLCHSCHLNIPHIRGRMSQGRLQKQ